MPLQLAPTPAVMKRMVLFYRHSDTSDQHWQYRLPCGEDMHVPSRQKDRAGDRPANAPHANRLLHRTTLTGDTRCCFLAVSLQKYFEERFRIA